MPRSKNAVTVTFSFEGVRHFITGKNKRDANEKMAIMKSELEKGAKVLNPKSLTFKEWADICLDDYKSNLEPLTLTNYRIKMNKWVISEIGGLKLKQIKPLHCQQILNNMQGMATDTIRKVHQLMCFAFDKAVQNNCIFESPAKYLTMPKGTKTTRRSITAKERELILKVADTNEKYVYFLFMLFCGCRPSEVAEIKAFDITNVDDINVLHIRGTKSDNADRQVPIPDYLMQRIHKTGKFNYLFTNANGGKLNPNNRNTLWKHFRRDLNIMAGCKIYRNQLIPPYPIADDLVPYCLRHTYCTDLMKQDVDVRTAQKLMGHSSINLTADIYTHFDNETLLEVARKTRNNGENVVPHVVPTAVSIGNTR